MIEQAIRTIRTLLPLNTSISLEQVELAVESVLQIPQYKHLNKETLTKEILSNYNIRMDDFRIIEAFERKKPWINDKKANIKWNFWKRYSDYLLIEKNLPQNVVNQLDKLTDKTLDSLFDPTINVLLHKYGLVVGQVQSGKTSNYTGLICKAADSGFKLIIVLAGIHNNLRSQTQIRLDEGFLGFNTKFAQVFNNENPEGIWIGVGRISRSEIAHSITSCLDNGDFSQGAFNSLGLNFNTNEPIIAVVKKNPRILERIKQWLTAQATDVDGKRVILNKSLLLIDDEADNASINTNPENDEATKINKLIRGIIELFDKSGYVGYTATPFANIFIPIQEDQLFPRDFIINIPAPSNYIGPERIFGFKLEDDNTVESTLPIINRIDDYEEYFPSKHKKKSELPDDIPDSLKQAIKCFIITCAIRCFRGQVKVHNSMLIHVSRYTNWQNKIKQLVENNFNYYRRGIEMNIPLIMEELRRTFEVDTDKYKSFKTISNKISQQPLFENEQTNLSCSWNDIKDKLYESSMKIQVNEINGGSADVLNYMDYKDGLSVITIGGDKLSRGLTLEGLSISYYLRASKMYDTLMQMGRWFGYRPGYVDLCRLFTSKEINEWFCHITLASEELRDEFDYMSNVAGSTPEQYALKVRTHPGVLQISASNKIRRAEYIEVSWSGRLVETYQLRKDTDSINANLDATVNMIQSIDIPLSIDYSQSNYVWKECIPSNIIKNFLNNFRVPDSLKKVNPMYLIDYINVCEKNGELYNWSIAIMSKKETNIRFKKINGFDIGCWERSDAKERSDNDTYFIIKNHILASAKDEAVDLPQDIKDAAYKKTIESNPKYSYDYAQGEVLRNEFRSPNNPLLLIYFLDPKGAFGEVYESEPIIGFAISFPSSKTNPKVQYAIHNQLLSLFNFDDDSDEADYGDN